MNSPSRRCLYTAGQKLRAKEIGNRSTGWEFGINEATIRLWRKQEGLLTEMSERKRQRHWSTPPLFGGKAHEVGGAG